MVEINRQIITAITTGLILWGEGTICAKSAQAFIFGFDFRDSYSSQSLGPIPLDTGGNIPGGYGGLAFMDADTLLIGGSAYSPEAAIYQVDLVRDPSSNRIISYSAPATFFANAPGIGSVDPDIEAGGLDGGLIFAPNGTLLYTTYFDNSIGQIKPGSTNPDKFINLSPLGIDPPSTGGLIIVPEGFPGAGRLKISSYDNGNFYDALLLPDGQGTYDISVEGSINLNPDDGSNKGLEGIVYLNNSYPNFTTDSVLIAEYNNNNIGAYEIDENGDPIKETERLFVSGFPRSGAGSHMGLIVDPVTGDLLLSTDSAFTNDGSRDLGSQLVLFKAEAPPPTTPDNNPFDPITLLDLSTGATTASGAVSTSNDVYAIQAQAGELVSVDVNVTEILSGLGYTNDDTQLYLYNSEGDILAFSEDKADSFASRVLNFLVPEDGTYYIAVTTAGNEAILELGDVNQLLGFQETGLANVVYDLNVSRTSLSLTARLFDIALAIDPDNPVGSTLIDGDQVLFVDLNGTRNTDLTGPLQLFVNADENTVTFDNFEFILEFAEPFPSTDINDILDLFTTSEITAIIPPDELIQDIIFTERSLSSPISPNQPLPGQSVPEPASVLGLLSFGALGMGSKLKRKKQFYTSPHNNLS
ncbi:pre-peptidase C-terminal domain-containing protein [Crocosphaera subtropica]|nr:pre-peptidase C-terminal domain-containing protein [Crocosphaera subtropica]